MSQEERTKLREGVPCVKLYRYNPQHPCPKLNGFRDNGKWSLKLWQLLHTYWLPNSCWNWQENVVSVMLISVLNIKVTCEWHKAINLNCKVSRTHETIHRVRSTIPHTGMLSGDVTRLAWNAYPCICQASRVTSPLSIPVWCIVLRTLCIITRVRETLQFKLMALCHSQVTLMLSKYRY